MTLGWTSAFGCSPQSACLSSNSPAYTGVSTPPTKDHRCQSVSTQTENQDSLHSGSAKSTRESPELPLSLQRLLCRKPHHSSNQTTLQAEQKQPTLVLLPPCETRVSGAAYNPHNPSETPTMGTRSKQTTCDPGSKSLLSSIETYPHD